MACNCQQYKLPHMYIKDGDARDRRNRYAANQGRILQPWLDPAKPALFYRLADFDSMLTFLKNLSPTVDAVRMYFAVYDKDANPPVPPGCGDQFTFLFAPAQIVDPEPMTAKDYGNNYFSIPPGGPFDSVNGRINAHIAQRWIGNWVNGPLAEIPVEETSTNYDRARDIYTDTQCMVYSIAHLDELLVEAKCQRDADSAKVGGFNLYLASYLDKDKDFPKRLSTHFTLADPAGDDSDIDVSCRDPHIFESADTGNPCPPATGCNT